MTTKLRKLFATTIVMAIGCLASTAQAANLTWDGGAATTDWSTANNWNPNQAPTAPDTMVIGGSAVVDFNTTLNSTVPNGTTVIDINDNAQLNLTGGSLTLQDGNSNTSSIAIAANAVLNISGGTHNLYGRISVSEPGTIRVTGNDATINLRQVAGFSGGTFEFVFDSDGVSSLDYYSYINPTSNNLFVDGTAFTRTSSSQNFTLIDSTNLLGGEFQAANIAVVGLGAEGSGWTLTQDQVTDDITITVAGTPEPSTFTLVVLGLLSFGMTRRRRRRRR